MKDIHLKYLDKLISDLQKIKPYWAVDENIKYLLDSEIKPSYGRYHIYKISTKTLMSLSDLKEVNKDKLFNRENSINDRRISRILDRWENGKFVDPPKIGFNKQTKKIVFSDGRHRFKLSYFLEIDKIPVAIEKDNVKDIITAANRLV